MNVRPLAKLTGISSEGMSKCSAFAFLLKFRYRHAPLRVTCQVVGRHVKNAPHLPSSLNFGIGTRRFASPARSSEGM